MSPCARREGEVETKSLMLGPISIILPTLNPDVLSGPPQTGEPSSLIAYWSPGFDLGRRSTELRGSPAPRFMCHAVQIGRLAVSDLCQILPADYPPTPPDKQKPLLTKGFTKWALLGLNQ